MSGKPHHYARYVAETLKQQGYLDIRLEEEVRKRLLRVKGRKTIPFDIGYFVPTPYPHREYIECKYKGRKEKLATQQDVSKFILDLETCGISLKRGSIVTNNGYMPGAMDFARVTGVALYTLPREGRKEGPLDHYVSLLTRPVAIIGAVKDRLDGKKGLPLAFARVA